MNSTDNNNKTAGQQMVFDKYVAIALVVGIVAGFIIGNSVGSNRAKMSNTASSTDKMMLASSTDSMMEANNESSMMMSGDWISVEEQKAGNMVKVSKLTLDGTYWVAVRDDHSTTKNPYVLGAKKLMKGTYTDESIYVSRATEAGKSYEVVLFKDAPDFNYSASMLIKDGDHPKGATFKAN